ncbi:hypothetical protein Hamer_G013658 [Homarus americanus]|uniref:Uncharacterized protein n=1 Tax=Homarus americanus TaxID=6706 RepID=A0A8J5K3B0_HOMAM|nr:hypothetical protein Hamer_G013658 [Homarus americanus]
MVLCVLSPVARQVLASISGSLVTLLIMCTWAFPSVALPQMVYINFLQN